MWRGTGPDETEKIEEGVVGRGDGDMAAAASGAGLIARPMYSSTPGLVTPSPVVPAVD
jgi:hypothetical protein